MHKNLGISDLYLLMIRFFSSYPTLTDPTKAQQVECHTDITTTAVADGTMVSVAGAGTDTTTIMAEAEVV